MWYGRLVTSGQWTLPVTTLEHMQAMIDELDLEFVEPDDVGLLAPDLLAAQGYTVVRNDEGYEYIVGPTSWPRGAPPRLGSVLRLEQATSGAAVPQGSSSESLPRAEARRQVAVSREYAAWSAAVGARDVWNRAQARRAYLIGELMIYDGATGTRAVLARAAQDRDPAVRELWSTAELAADYPDGWQQTRRPRRKAATPAV